MKRRKTEFPPLFCSPKPLSSTRIPRTPMRARHASWRLAGVFSPSDHASEPVRNDAIGRLPPDRQPGLPDSSPACPVVVRTPRAPLPCVPLVSRCRAYPACPVAVRTARVPHFRAHRSCPVAVGRDVPIAPPRPGAVRGLASRAPLPCAPRVPPLRAARCLAATARGGSPPLGSA